MAPAGAAYRRPARITPRCGYHTPSGAPPIPAAARRLYITVQVRIEGRDVAVRNNRRRRKHAYAQFTAICDNIVAQRGFLPGAVQSESPAVLARLANVARLSQQQVKINRPFWRGPTISFPYTYGKHSGAWPLSPTASTASAFAGPSPSCVPQSDRRRYLPRIAVVAADAFSPILI